MVLSQASSRMASNIGSDLALSELIHANGSTDNAPAFPSVRRTIPEKTATGLPDDAISSMTNKGALPPPQEKKSAMHSHPGRRLVDLAIFQSLP